MDYGKLLKIAEGKVAEQRYERSNGEFCDTSLPPPKKLPKSHVQSDAIKRFLQKRKEEDLQKAIEAKRKKEELLALREQSRGKTKAKIMASRTKDNDFSRIKLTDDELEAKKRREQELIRLRLNDKVARMKARIELEEQEKMLPKKRKRKSKDPNSTDAFHDEHDDDYLDSEDYPSSSQRLGKEMMNKKPKLPPPSFQELLQLAQKKQFEPVNALTNFQDDDSRPLSKKARKLLEEEENSIRRKLAAEAGKKISHSVENIPSDNSIRKLPKIGLKKRPASENLTPNSAASRDQKIVNRPVHENRLSNESFRKEKNGVNQSRSQAVNSSVNRSGGFLKPDQPRQLKNNLNVNNGTKPSSSGERARVAHQSKAKDMQNGMQINKFKSLQNGSQPNKPNGLHNTKVKPADNAMRGKEVVMKSKKISNETTNKNKINKPKAVVPIQKTEKRGIDEEMMAEIERRVRTQVQKELEAKFMLQQQQQPKSTSNGISKSQPSSQKAQVNAKSQVRTNSVPVKAAKVVPSSQKLRECSLFPEENRTLSTNQKPPQKCLTPKPMNERQVVMKAPPPPPPKRKLPPPPPPPPKPMRAEKPRKPAFHPNPYLQPPRRLLVSQLPQRPSRRIESDDDEDEDDEEMNEFIDDECGDSSENYSQYIKEIFGYDRSRYLDDDDDDVMETSFAEQMKEECRSAKIARKEDLEEEMKEREEMRRKMMKKKQKSKK